MRCEVEGGRRRGRRDEEGAGGGEEEEVRVRTKRCVGGENGGEHWERERCKRRTC